MPEGLNPRGSSSRGRGTWLDRLLQRWRIGVAGARIPLGARVLDVGCGDGALFRVLGKKLGGGIGMDPRGEALGPDAAEAGRFRLMRGKFPDDMPDGELFGAITLLAVLEHIPRREQSALARACYERLMSGGCVVATVPSPAVDGILGVLMKLGLVEGMAVEEHYGFDPEEADEVFIGAGFQRKLHRRFQLGLNHLFVWAKGGPISA